jgi:hypothetical protein
MIGGVSKRALTAAIAVIAVFAIAAVVGTVVVRRGSAPSSGAVDWTVPIDLPSPVRPQHPSEVVSAEEGSRFSPRSGRVTPSQAYRFDTGRCGLGFLVDFDGSFWEPVDPGAVPDALLADEDVGAIALVDFDRAVYRSSHGIEVELRRLPGPVITRPCA